MITESDRSITVANDDTISEMILRAKHRIVYLAPLLSKLAEI
jgi:hypothetical protein